MARSTSHSTTFTSATFGALAIAACALSVMYAGVLESTVIFYLASAALLLSVMAGFSGSFESDRDFLGAKEENLKTRIKRVAIKAAAVLVGLAAFGLSMFATSYAGVIESFITTTAAALSIVVGIAAGFMAGYDLEALTQLHEDRAMSDHALKVGPSYLALKPARAEALYDAPWPPIKQQKAG